MDQFLQSAGWEHFQRKSGHEVLRLSENAFGAVHILPVVGAYIYLSRWPSKKNASNLSEDFLKLLSWGRLHRCAWIRIEPETDDLLASCATALASEDINMVKSLVSAPHDMQPREIFVMDIAKSEEALLSEMKAKTRYNVRLAEKKNVHIFKTREKKYQEIFFALVEATAKRQRIIPHPRVHYIRMLESFPEEDLTLFVAEYQGEIVAANLVLFEGDTATYLHGGTGDTHRAVMAPVLLQWEQIREAKRRGCHWYDFGGVKTNPVENGPHDWSGITRFKTGFSPDTKPIQYPGCFDIVIDRKRYELYLRLRFLQRHFSLMKRFFQKKGGV